MSVQNLEETPNFVSPEFLRAVEHDRAQNGQAYFREFIFTEDVKKLIKAVQKVKEALASDKEKNREYLHFVADDFMAAARDAKVGHLVKMDANYKLDLEGLTKAIIHEMGCVQFDQDTRGCETSEDYNKTALRHGQKIEAEKDAVRQKLTIY